MKRQLTMKVLITLGIFSVSLLLPVAAMSWNQATHAYIADQLGATAGHDNLLEMWGSTAPDFFNYIFDPALCPGWVSDQTHGLQGDTFLSVWNAAAEDAEKALAYGFVSHNEPWGADHAAHEACLTCGESDGYIIAKARQLLGSPLNPANPLLSFADAFATLGMNPDEALLIAHVSTEYAVDIMLGQNAEPLLGRKLATAARGETRRFRPLLVTAYGADYAAVCFDGDDKAAAAALTAVEQGHRKDMIFLGHAISRPEPVAAQLLAEQLAALLPEFLSGPLPVPEAAAVEILKAGITAAMALCGDDYQGEIDATIDFVGQSLNGHGIAYRKQGNPQKRP